MNVDLIEVLARWLETVPDSCGYEDGIPVRIVYRWQDIPADCDAVAGLPEAPRYRYDQPCWIDRSCGTRACIAGNSAILNDGWTSLDPPHGFDSWEAYCQDRLGITFGQSTKRSRRVPSLCGYSSGLPRSAQGGTQAIRNLLKGSDYDPWEGVGSETPRQEAPC